MPNANCRIHIAASIFFAVGDDVWGSIEDGRREAEYGTREAAVWIEPLEKGDQIYEKISQDHNLSKNNFKNDKKNDRQCLRRVRRQFGSKPATTSEFNGVVSCGTGCLFELLPPKNRLNEAFIRKMRASWHSKPGWLFQPFGAENG